MKYTIKKLAEIAGVSTRTLRYYDQIDLLNPSLINKNNYRIYDEKNVNKLQQIMFYRTLGFPLDKIKRLMDDPDFSRQQALQEQQRLLLSKKAEIELLLTNISQTIQSDKGEQKMTDSEKFVALKKVRLSENETKYGSEIRSNYGVEVVERANEKFGDLTENEFEQMQKVENQLIADLVELKKHPDLESLLAQCVYKEHKAWLQYTWSSYTKSAHRGLVDLYVADDRFADYYDAKAKTPVARLLRDVVYQYTN